MRLDRLILRTISILVILFGPGLRSLFAGSPEATGKPPLLTLHIFHQLKSGNPLPVELVTDHGIMVINDGDFAHPQPRFVLASRSNNRLATFHTLQEIEDALSELPRATILHRYDRCGSPAAFGLPEVWDQLERFCQDHGIQIAPEAHITCVCPD